MPVILFIVCLVWFLSTTTIQNGRAAIGRIAQEKQSEKSGDFKNRITDLSAESSLDGYIANNRVAAWEEADRFTIDMPTWKKVRSLGYEPHVAASDVITVLMVCRHGKLPQFKVSFPDFPPPSYFSKKLAYEYNGILRDEFVLAIEKELQKHGNDVKLIVETREYDGRNRCFNRYYTLSEHILPNGARDETLKNKSTNYKWSGTLTPTALRRLDTGSPVYGTDFIGF